MKRGEFISLLSGAAVAWPLAALGQQQPAKLARIGFVRAAGADNKDFTAFRGGLRALGYVEGQNIVTEQRYAAGSYDRVGEFAAELVRLNVVDGFRVPASARRAAIIRPKGPQSVTGQTGLI
jgi:putative tryptophan/tyrosine transport system substrate-binding protein